MTLLIFGRTRMPLNQRVEPAFDASPARLGFNFLDLHLSHSPFAFQPGDEQDARDQSGSILSLDGLLPIYESARNQSGRGPSRSTVSIMEFRSGTVVHETPYFADPWRGQRGGTNGFSGSSDAALKDRGNSYRLDQLSGRDGPQRSGSEA